MGLKPHTYLYRRSEYPGMALPSGKQCGLVAQEEEEILPEIVMDNVHPARYDGSGNLLSPEIGFKSLYYQELIPVLIKAIQEQQEQIDRQEQEIEALKAAMGKD